MIERLQSLWPHLQQLPVFWLLATLTIFQGFSLLAQRFKQPLINPVGLSILSLVAVLYVTRTPYAQYWAGAQWLHFVLGPATVALAVPLYQQRARVLQMWRPLGLTLVWGSLCAILSATAIGWLLGASAPSLLALAPKSATAPVAMGIVEKLGGIVSLTAALVILTGVTGAVLGPWLLDRLKITTPAVRGFSLGLVSHGIGTSRAFQESEETGAFAGLGMGLNALMTSLLVPLLYRLL